MHKVLVKNVLQYDPDTPKGTPLHQSTLSYLHACAFKHKPNQY